MQMQKRFLLLVIGLLAIVLFVNAQTIKGKYSSVPQYMRLSAEEKLSVDGFNVWMTKRFNLPAANGFKLLSKETDQLGMVHYRYQQTVNNYPVEGTMYIVHTKNGMVQSISGDLLDKLVAPVSPSVNKNAAVDAALASVNATEYKWNSEAAEKALKENTGNPNATYMPQPELVYIGDNNKLGTEVYHLAWKMDVYATKPLSRNYIYVDAVTGQVLYKKNRILHADAPATAHTQYNGVQTITTDSYNGAYRLREAARGQGVRTYNALQSQNPTNTDFTNATTDWNNVNTEQDQYATDAHFASEMTYDFYNTNFNRNSLDNNGLALVAYVHYDQNMDNAFWDGGSMNYGDGNLPTTTPYTTLDIGGHEITHGLTQYTADLNYQDESGALNESFSDCFGVAIRQYVQQNPGASIDYLIGNDNGPAFRSMRTPKTYGQPDTYLGQYWYTGTQDDGGVHTNSGVQNHWFYVAAHGETGTNDNGATYNIAGIGIEKVQAITYRSLAIYLTPSSQYADARTYSIQAAQDLYGACSPEVEAVANSWHAVGVGPAFVAEVTSDFNVPVTTACSVPATISFADASSNAIYYVWNFGDGSTSNQKDPSHTFTSYGDFSVELMSWSPDCGADSITKTAIIHIEDNRPMAHDTTICQGTSSVLSASGSGTLNWYDASTGGTLLHNGASYSTPAVNQNTVYYVENVIPGPAGVAGPADHSMGTGGYNNFEHYQLFNCTKPLKLVSVVIDANSAGARTIELHDANDAVIATTTVTLTTGSQTVPLNFSVPAQNGLRLGIWTGTIALYRNSNGASYPYYSTDSALAITGNDVGDPDRYYFFYDWQLLEDPCVSERVPVNVSVLTNGCTSGIDEVSSLETLSLLPNPANTTLNIKANAPAYNHDGRLTVRNMLGESVVDRNVQISAGSNTWSLDVASLASGMYLFTLQSGKTSVTKRFVKE